MACARFTTATEAASNTSRIPRWPQRLPPLTRLSGATNSRSKLSVSSPPRDFRMAQNFIEHGNALQLPAAPYALAPGDGCLIGSLFGVSQNESAIGTECVLAVVGVHRIEKVLTEG